MTHSSHDSQSHPADHGPGGIVESSGDPAAFTPLSREEGGGLRLSDDPGSAASLEILHADEHSRVLRYVIQPGERTGWHQHHLDFVTIHLSEGTMTGYSVPPGGSRAHPVTRSLTFSPGRIVPHRAPLEHDAVNTGEGPIFLYEIEFTNAAVSVVDPVSSVAGHDT
ncbi:hypothetical protein IQ216_00770 [Cyanobium sp. LEGE 06143]|uniref:hypothetical protein n=1 Tax=Cyanobium sp. LEGE 06143 TaxID=945727 RepID=UPI001881BDD9|nr:hypothetical protein [Cyanobium sp. LEGE 06143]MBE9171670.1 hypothetical protein [Cyanobium sp. LEGE 06143]